MPEDPSENKPGAAKTKRFSRRVSLARELKLDDPDDLEMPPCDAYFLIGFLFEIGPTSPGDMGHGKPVSHTEINSWQRNTGIDLDAWQARTLHRLSREYANQVIDSLERDCPAPWQDAPYAKPTASLVAERMKQATRNLAKL